MHVQESDKVGEIAGRYPATIAVFERFGVDYCCGGKRSVRDAAERAGVEPRTLVDEVSRAASEPSEGEQRAPAEQSLRALIRHINDSHHVFTRSAIDVIERTLPKVLAAHGSTHPELSAIGDATRALVEDLGPHLLREERVLFPWIEAAEAAIQRGERPPSAPFGSVQNPVRVMDAEHLEVARLLETLTRLTAGYEIPAWACPTATALFRTLGQLDHDLRRHVHLESNVLFPRAIAL